MRLTISRRSAAAFLRFAGVTGQPSGSRQRSPSRENETREGYTPGRFYEIKDILAPKERKLKADETPDSEREAIESQYGEAIATMDASTRTMAKLKKALNLAETDEERDELRKEMDALMNEAIRAYNRRAARQTEATD